MAMTANDLQTELAYRLGETSAPSDSTTYAVRLSWLNKAYFDIARRFNWWWQEGASTATTTTSLSYALPTDFKIFHPKNPVKIEDEWRIIVPFSDLQIYDGLSSVVQLPINQASHKAYIYSDSIYFIESSMTAGQTITMYYYKRVTKLTDTDDTTLIPDEYLEALLAFGEARYWMSITQQAKAVAPFQEYEQIVQQMEEEQGRRGWTNGSNAILDPDDVID